jgi:6-phosphofructokinase 1
MIQPDDLKIRTLGEPTHPSPLKTVLARRRRTESNILPGDRILFDNTMHLIAERGRDAELPAFESAGPRPETYFTPEQVRAGVVTCGGLCPGINDVIRGLVMVLWHRYGVRQIEGFRYGYEGLNPAIGHEPMTLTPDAVMRIHQWGGTILGTSRGPQDPATCIDFLLGRGVNVLFTIGGDGTQRGALALAEEARRRGADLAIVGLPKTIDNDILYVEQSFGFQTAFTKAVDAIDAAHTEALAARNGVGLVKVMGRHSGFIAAYAGLANNDANYVLIPEVPFPLDGGSGLLAHLEQRLAQRNHAVLVCAEGAGQQYVQGDGADKSGNQRLGDIGLYLKDRITDHFKSRGEPITVKYIDPSYMIRGLPATPHDSVLCFRLAAYAVHAAMSGRTDLIIGKWHGRFVHVPIEMAVRKRQVVDPMGDLWLSVLETTGQPTWSADADAQTAT